jgi:TRAP-type mannitol/chloroaromatic compound transport system permease large subunit
MFSAFVFTPTFVCIIRITRLFAAALLPSFLMHFTFINHYLHFSVVSSDNPTLNNFNRTIFLTLLINMSSEQLRPPILIFRVVGGKTVSADTHALGGG